MKIHKRQDSNLFQVEHIFHNGMVLTVTVINTKDIN